MEYVDQLYAYTSFLEEDKINIAELERYVNESILIASGKNTALNMISLNEGVVDKLKNAINKIMEVIARLWGKFMEAIHNLVNSNKTYLEKYKDIILKKKFKDATYTMPDYFTGQKRIMDDPVPAFNFETMKEQLVDAETFINGSNIKNYLINGSKLSYQEQFKYYFQGGTNNEIKYSAQKVQANVNIMYNYCYNYEGIAKVLKKDRDQIEAAANRAIELITQEEQNKNNGQTDNTTDQAATKESYRFDSKYYSHVYESYILEADAPAPTGNDANKEAKPGAAVTVAKDATSSGQNGSSGASATGSNMKNISGDVGTDEGTQKAANQGNTDIDDNITRCRNYITVCGWVLSAKQTISEAIFKNYMSIIRSHVQDYVGTSDKPNNNNTTAPRQNAAPNNNDNTNQNQVGQGEQPVEGNTGESGTPKKETPEEKTGIGKWFSDKATAVKNIVTNKK